jgi:hypothetical protein
MAKAEAGELPHTGCDGAAVGAGDTHARTLTAGAP